MSYTAIYSHIGLLIFCPSCDVSETKDKLNTYLDIYTRILDLPPYIYTVDSSVFVPLQFFKIMERTV